MWLPYVARVLGAPEPRHLPVWLARLVAGEVAVSMTTQIRGSANDAAKPELGWRPGGRAGAKGSGPVWRLTVTARRDREWSPAPLTVIRW